MVAENQVVEAFNIWNDSRTTDDHTILGDIGVRNNDISRDNCMTVLVITCIAFLFVPVVVSAIQITPMIDLRYVGIFEICTIL